jgi:DNA polymerase III delta subunit
MVIILCNNRWSFDWFIIFSVEKSKEGVRKMKLSEYLYKEMILDHWEVKEKDIQKWIFDWYVGKYERRPPIWLLGKKKGV